MSIDENEVWEFLDKAGTIFEEATGRELNDFDSDDDWQECVLKFFREMADELKACGVTFDKTEGEYVSTLRTSLEQAQRERDELRDEVRRYKDYTDQCQDLLHKAAERERNLFEENENLNGDFKSINIMDSAARIYNLWVGRPVFDVVRGWGVVIDIRRGLKGSLLCKFECGQLAYADNGHHYESDLYPSLYLADIFDNTKPPKNPAHALLSTETLPGGGS